MTSPYPPYSPPAAPYPVRLPLHPRATLSMVLGIVGVAGFFVLLVPVFACPFAWYYGAVADREAQREPHRYRAGSEARSGMIMGMIGSALLGLLLLLLLIGGALAILGSQYDAGYGT